MNIFSINITCCNCTCCKFMKVLTKDQLKDDYGDIPI